MTGPEIDLFFCPLINSVNSKNNNNSNNNNNSSNNNNNSSNEIKEVTSSLKTLLVFIGLYILAIQPLDKHFWHMLSLVV